MVLNRYFIWNAYTHNVPVYMLCKLVIINQAKEMLHCFFLPNVHPTFHHRNPQHASLWNPEFGAICLDPPPTCEKLNRLILAGPLAGPRAFVCLASLCCWCSFYLSIFFTLSLYTTTSLHHSGRALWDRCVGLWSSFSQQESCDFSG